MYTQPQMTYNVKVNGNTVELGSNTKVSYQPGHNSVAVTCTCTNQSFSKFQIWVTEATEENWGLEIGRKVTLNRSETGSFKQNTPYTFGFTISNDVFKDSVTYRLALCTKGDIDGSWDVTEILIVLNGLIFKPTDSQAVELIVNR